MKCQRKIGKLMLKKRLYKKELYDNNKLNEHCYPIEWNEMLGRIFHKIIFKYKNKTLNTLPRNIFHSYR